MGTGGSCQLIALGTSEQPIDDGTLVVLIRGGSHGPAGLCVARLLAKKKRTKRDVFLWEMAAVVPWGALEGVSSRTIPRSARRAGGGRFLWA